MKGWLYVISNQAVRGMVKIGATAKDPLAYAAGLDKGGLPFPHKVGYEALVPDIEEAERIVATALADQAEGKGWFSCTVAEAVRVIAGAISGSILMETRYDEQSRIDKLYDEVTNPDPARRAVVLSDPSCPPDVLQFALEREEDEGVLLAMLANPSCEALGSELTEFADRMKGNRAVLLAMASNHRLHSEVLESVYWARVGGESPDSVTLALVRNPRFPVGLLVDAMLECDAPNEIIPAVVARWDCVSEALAMAVYVSPDNPVLRAMAERHHRWSPEAFRTLLEDSKESCPPCVAEHPDCPPDILEELWTSGDMETAEAVLLNPACPPRILVEASVAGEAETSRDSAIAMLADLAMSNPSNPLALVKAATSWDEFQALAQSEFPRVVLRTAEKPTCPSEILTQLSKHEDANVRKAVVGNRSSAPAVLSALACDSSAPVRRAVVERSDCPREALARLACDSLKNVRMAVAMHLDCPEEALANLAYDGEPRVRAAAVRNPKCPRDILESYAQQELFEWRLIVLDNPACPESIVELLLKDANPLVVKAARQIKFGPKKPKVKRVKEEPVEVIRERFRDYVRRTLGAVIEETELLRLAALPDDAKEKFAQAYPSQAKQLALFEKYLLPRLSDGGRRDVLDV